MNRRANGKSAGTTVKEIESAPVANSKQKDERRTDKTFHYSHPKIEDDSPGEIFSINQILQGIKKIAANVTPTAKRLAPVVAGVVANAKPLASAAASALAEGGEMEAEQMEAAFFGTHEAEAEVAATETARDAALTEVLAAEATHCESESEAEALIGTAVPIAISSMGGKRALRHVMPTLVHSTTQLVRFLHRRGSAGRQLLRLIPTILRRTVASLHAAQQSGHAINSDLVRRLMALQAAQVLSNSQLLMRAMTRNTLIRQHTVALAEPMSCPFCNSPTRRSSKMANQQEALFEAPAAHEQAVRYSNPYSSAEFEDEWEYENPYSGNPYSNPEFEAEWENQEASHYANPYSSAEFEDEWENQEAYSNPQFEDEWENQEAYSNPEFEYEWENQEAYSNPEFEYEWENQEANPYGNPYSSAELEYEWEYENPYSNPELENEGEYFSLKDVFKKVGQGFKKVAKKVVPIAKKLAPVAANVVGMSPIGMGVKIASSLLNEAEMEAENMEAELFGSNEAEAEVALNEVAHEAALGEFLAATAAEAESEAEAGAAAAAALPVTVSAMGGRRALRHILPLMAQATARLVSTFQQQGEPGNQLLRLLPTIQRRTVAALRVAARQGQPIDGSLVSSTMAAMAHRVLSNPDVVQGAITRNAVLYQRTALPHSDRHQSRQRVRPSRRMNDAVPEPAARR
ncbi:hypothetical protein [Allocoleopsis sp.]|uniref:hypothetical protein n=1 Tax=Allocoleopsis sp. TaxID=3088169 RepID=UPI002FD0A855